MSLLEYIATAYARRDWVEIERLKSFFGDEKIDRYIAQYLAGEIILRSAREHWCVPEARFLDE